jgi:hypothetical protein
VRAPQKSDQDEIVRQLVKKLNEEEQDRDLSSEIYVQSAIKTLQALDQKVAYRGLGKEHMPVRGKWRDNIDQFKVVRAQIKNLREALKNTSAPALFLLFSGEQDVSSDEGVMSFVVQRRAKDRLQQTIGMLKGLQGRCDYLLTERPGEHGSVDFRQRRVAAEAWRLLKRHEQKPASGIATSLYGQVTSLLWEAVTGEQGKDLERACRTILMLADEGRIAEAGEAIWRGQIQEGQEDDS